MRLSAILCSGLLTACAAAPPGADVPEDELLTACGTVLQDCRGPHTVRLLKSDGSMHEVAFEIDVPVVQNDGFVTLYPGETVHLEAEVLGDEVVRLTSVPEVRDPDRTITLELSQSDGEVDMFFVAKNPFPRPLKYRMGMQVLDRDGLFATSSCPVVAEGSAYEMWPHPIFQLVLADFHLLPADTASFMCE